MPELKVTWLSLNEFLRLNMMNSILMHHKDHAYNYCYNRGAFHIWKFLNLIMVTEFYLDWMSSEFCGSCILYCWLSLSLIWWKHFSICLVKVICWVKAVAVLSLKCYCINSCEKKSAVKKQNLCLNAWACILSRYGKILVLLKEKKGNALNNFYFTNTKSP